VNELRQLNLAGLPKLWKGEDLKITLFQINRSHSCRLLAAGAEKLKELKPEIDFLTQTQKLEYLFGKKLPLERKTLIPTIYQNMKATCRLYEILETITSHSFPISLVSKLLGVTSVPNMADIMGHNHIRTIQLCCITDINLANPIF
jgi:hypothetical protein